MDYFLLSLVIIFLIGVPLMIVFIHDGVVQAEKTDKDIKDIRANETCAELKSDMAFTDQQNQGVWIKSSYDSDVLKYYKEKHCK